MQYISTRGHTSSASFNDVLLTGLAPDGGLYVPEYYPELRWLDIVTMRDWSYNQIAQNVLSMFIGNDIGTDCLSNIIAAAYNPQKFGSYDITPIQPLGNRWSLLKLSNGPTFAFKDVGLQLLAGLMDHVLQERDEVLNILGATSGDTGSAAEEAVRGKERIRIFMLSPYGRMTPFQQMQMYRIHDPSIFNLVADGNFDNCQTAVKLVNADAAFKQRYSIGAVNSINWGRILAQLVYYVYAYVRTVASSDEIMTVVVPSGNFGNALSAYVARRMGLRINIIVATNSNDVLHEFFQTGTYRVRKNAEVLTTNSPSMDIASASNFERFMFDQVERDASHLFGLWQRLADTGSFSFSVFLASNDGFDIDSGTATNAEVIDTIKHFYNLHGIVIDPHTAVAVKVAWDHNPSGFGPVVIAETAQPAKFEAAIAEAIGLRMGIPSACKHLLNQQDKYTRIEETDPAAIADAVKNFIETSVG